MTDTELLARIVDASEDAIVSVSPDGLFTSWNGGAERLFGYTAAEVLGRPLLILAPDGDVTRMSEIVARVMSGERVPPYETLRVGKDGRPIPVSVTAAPLRDDTGAVVGAGAIMRDVATQTRERAELARSKERLAVSQRVAQVGSWEWDLRTGVVTWSDELYRLFGRDPRTFMPSTDALNAQLHPDDRDRVVALVHGAIAERREFAYEARIILADRSVRVMAARGEVALGDDLSVTRVYGIGQDITERRAIADQLRRERETLELIGQATNDLLWDWDLRTGQVKRSPGIARYGYTPEEAYPSNDWWTARVHPDDLPTVEATITEAIETGQLIWSAAFRFERKDGSYASVVDRGHIVRDAAGSPVRMVGSMAEVTGRGRAPDLIDGRGTLPASVL